MKIYTADKETGTFIDEFKTMTEALNAISEYEQQDRIDGSYSEGFYDVVDEEHLSYSGRDVTVTEYAELYNVNTATIRKRILRGTTSARKLGSMWILTADQPMTDHRKK